jgi:hypothetical protein
MIKFLNIIFWLIICSICFWFGLSYGHGYAKPDNYGNYHGENNGERIDTYNDDYGTTYVKKKNSITTLKRSKYGTVYSKTYDKNGNKIDSDILHDDGYGNLDSEKTGKKYKKDKYGVYRWK